VINATFPVMSIDQVAIITGASRGIGRAIAKRLYEDGANIAWCARSPIQDYSSDRSIAISMDVRDQKSVDAGVRRILDRFGKIDIVVNNAGISAVTPVDARDTSGSRRNARHSRSRRHQR
jgi:NAD(P)-dependent dehydrogenase (short-subunit alcohol dehydrogenase family)